MTQSEFETKWHYKIVKPKGEHYAIPAKEYIVTACLLDPKRFAIMATDYSLENKQWITIDLDDEDIERLDDRFEILGDYQNIDYEILFQIVGTWRAKPGEFEGMDGDEDYITICSKNFTNGVVTVDNNLPLMLKDKPYKVGDWLYDLCWTSTNGEKLRKSYVAKSEDTVGLGPDEVREKFADIRNWIKGGLYHFGMKEDAFK